MNDPMQLLRAANPVTECEPPDYERLLEHLDETADQGEPAAERVWGRFLDLRSRKAPRHGWARATGHAPHHADSARGILAVLTSVAIAVAVAVVALVSLHGSGTRGPGPWNANGGVPAQTTSSSGSMAYPPGQARGRVVIGSMHRFGVAASGAPGQIWGAEWFRTSTGQICVQAGREVGGRLGYVDIDGIFPHDGRFHPWVANTAVDARCIGQPAHGGVALTVAERIADSGSTLPSSGACTAARHRACPRRDTTTLFFGVLGSGAVMAQYGTERHSQQSLSAGPGPDGEYIQAFWGGNRAVCLSRTPCPSLAPARLVHPASRAFVIYSGSGRTCRLDGPGTRGVMSGDCPYGLTLRPSPDRLTAREVRTPVRISTRATAHQVQVTARFHSRVASSRISDYSLQLTTPGTGCPNHLGGVGSASFGGNLQQAFRAGALITETNSITRCSGTYRGAIVVQPLVGHALTVDRFTFRVR